MKDRSERRCTNWGDTDDIESQKRLFVESDAIGKKRGTLIDRQTGTAGEGAKGIDEAQRRWWGRNQGVDIRHGG